MAFLANQQPMGLGAVARQQMQGGPYGGGAPVRPVIRPQAQPQMQPGGIGGAAAAGVQSQAQVSPGAVSVQLGDGGSPAPSAGASVQPGGIGGPAQVSPGGIGGAAAAQLAPGGQPSSGAQVTPSDWAETPLPPGFSDWGSYYHALPGGAPTTYGTSVTGAAGGGPSSPAGYTPDPSAAIDRTVYGGYAGGAQDWTKYYQQLGADQAGALAAKGQQEQGYYDQVAGRLNSQDKALGQQLGQQAYGDLSGQAMQAATLGRDAGNELAALGRQYGSQVGRAGEGAYLSQMAQAGRAFGQQGIGAAYGNQALAQLSSAAEGNGPSAAQEQLGRGVQSAIQAQMAGAASARGGAYAQAAAQNQAANQAAGIESNAIGSATALRAQEQQQAEQALMSGSLQQYQAAGGLGQSYLQGAEASRMSGLQAGGQLAMQGQQQGGMLGLQGEQLGLQGLGEANQLGGQFAMQGAQLGQQGGLQALGLGQQAGQSYDQAALQARQAYEQMAAGIQQQQLQAGTAQSGIAAGIQNLNTQIGQQNNEALIGGLGAAGSAALMGLAMMSDEDLKIGVNPQGDAEPGSNGIGATTAPFAASMLGMGTGEAAGGLDKSALKEMLGTMRGQFQGMTRHGPIAPAQIPQASITPAMQAPPIVVSDERAKRSVEKAPTADAFLDTLARSQSTYAYRNPADQPLTPMHPKLPGARYGGVMAQDLERVPEIGPQLVTQTPRGKMLEPGSVQSAMLMGLGRLAERLNALEKRKGAA